MIPVFFATAAAGPSGVAPRARKPGSDHTGPARSNRPHGSRHARSQSALGAVARVAAAAGGLRRSVGPPRSGSRTHVCVRVVVTASGRPRAPRCQAVGGTARSGRGLDGASPRAPRRPRAPCGRCGCEIRRSNAASIRVPGASLGYRRIDARMDRRISNRTGRKAREGPGARGLAPSSRDRFELSADRLHRGRGGGRPEAVTTTRTADVVREPRARRPRPSAAPRPAAAATRATARAALERGMSGRAAGAPGRSVWSEPGLQREVPRLTRPDRGRRRRSSARPQERPGLPASPSELPSSTPVKLSAGQSPCKTLSARMAA